MILLLISFLITGCQNEIQDTGEKMNEFTPPKSAGSASIGILYEGTFYRAFYPEQTSILPTDATYVGTIESQTYLESTKPYNEKQTNCLDLSVGSKLYILEDALYAYNSNTETYWIFLK